MEHFELENNNPQPAVLTHLVHSHRFHICEDIDLKQLQSPRKMQQSRTLHNQIQHKAIVTLLHCLLNTSFQYLYNYVAEL